MRPASWCEALSVSEVLKRASGQSWLSGYLSSNFEHISETSTLSRNQITLGKHVYGAKHSLPSSTFFLQYREKEPLEGVQRPGISLTKWSSDSLI